jgi:hypothetical protein
MTEAANNTHPNGREIVDGKTVALWCDGKKYIPGAVDLEGGDHRLIEDFYLAHLKEPAQAATEAMQALAKLPKTPEAASLRESIEDRLFQEILKGSKLRRPPARLVFEWLSSFEGVAFLAHLALSRNHADEFPDPRKPGFDLKKLDLGPARRLLNKIGTADMEQAVDDASPQACKIAAEARAAGLEPDWAKKPTPQ